MPTSLVFLRLPSSPVQTQIVGPVNVSTPELSALRADVANLRADIQRLSNSKVSEDGFKLLEAKVMQLDAKLSELQRVKESSSAKPKKPAQAPGSANR